MDSGELEDRLNRTRKAIEERCDDRLERVSAEILRRTRNRIQNVVDGEVKRNRVLIDDLARCFGLFKSKGGVYDALATPPAPSPDEQAAANRLSTLKDAACAVVAAYRGRLERDKEREEDSFWRYGPPLQYALDRLRAVWSTLEYAGFEDFAQSANDPDAVPEDLVPTCSRCGQELPQAPPQ